MLRTVLGVIAGYFIWSIVWVGTDSILAALSPGWYGKNSADFQNAISGNGVFTSSFTVCVSLIFLSVFFSLVAGFAAATIARENRKSTVALGVLLLITGVFVEAAYWNYLPLWYHILFLLLLIPATVAGGKLSKS